MYPVFSTAALGKVQIFRVEACVQEFYGPIQSQQLFSTPIPFKSIPEEIALLLNMNSFLMPPVYSRE